MNKLLVGLAALSIAAGVALAAPSPVECSEKKRSDCLFQCNLKEVACVSRCDGDDKCVERCHARGRSCRSRC